MHANSDTHAQGMRVIQEDTNQIKKTLFTGITIIHELSAHREQLLDFLTI